MPRNTRETIKTAFWQLLAQQPLNKITVNEIVNACGINRNSFYYHFESIPALIEEITEEILDKTIKAYPAFDSFEDCINAIMNMIIENRRAVYHIFNSVDREVLEKHLLKICHYAVSTYIESDLQKETDIDERTKNQLITYYKCEFFGQTIDWLQDGIKNDESERFSSFCELNRALYSEFLRRHREKNNS